MLLIVHKFSLLISKILQIPSDNPLDIQALLDVK